MTVFTEMDKTIEDFNRATSHLTNSSEDKTRYKVKVVVTREAIANYEIYVGEDENIQTVVEDLVFYDEELDFDSTSDVLIENCRVLGG